MKIALCYSMQFAEKADEVKKTLDNMGHQAFVSSDNEIYHGLSDDRKEKIKLDRKYKHDAIRNHWNIIKESEAILVLNYTKNKVANYIGGNTFLEMGFAHVLDKKIFLLNSLPETSHYITEVVAMKPTIINGDLSKLA